ncbi:HNH endonuclease [Fusobacterium massiliense]|uniref:HNH endonuclease n=1 Tax=Fusobacterium massiliense TaxID=1852365 RepID=UPI0028E661A0|nr:HNH endonuclease [Fusobacterium massiliense]
MDDYRRSKYCVPFKNITFNKNEFLKKLKLEFPRLKNVYLKIRENDNNYKIEFMKVYNCRCSYCGVSLDILNIRMFEIDHYIYRKANKFKNNNNANKIENLVLACQFCNRKKSDFLIPDSEYSLLYPDNEEIKKIFYRDEEYYIKIKNEYLQNEIIKKFYKQLEMAAEVRRLDFLLISLLNFKKKYRDKLENLHILNELSDIIEKLKKKRNITKN